MGERLCACDVLVGTPGGKRQIGILRSYTEVNIKMGLKSAGRTSIRLIWLRTGAGGGIF
jgi:hypothetical protein